MKIGLYGILGVYNFGCEAIIRGACRLIQKLYPEAQIIYFSYSYEFDKKALEDLNLEICPIESDATFWDKVLHKIKVKLNSERCGFYFDYERVINSVDMFFSVGGDIYTIPKFLRENKKYPYYNPLVEFCDCAIDAGKDVIVYGASVGPFGEYQRAVDYYKKNLSRYKMIICREQESVEYLKSIGLENVCFFPDPAFQVKAIEKEKCELKYIGVNLSPLSLREIYGKNDKENYVRFAAMLNDIYEKTQKEILLIAHVISPNEIDNDDSFLHQLKKLIAPEAQQHIHFAEWQQGFLGLKPQLKKCYLVVSARMHCAVNAIVENVPAIFLSYSQKSIGMCKFVYGSEEWLIDLKDAPMQLAPMIQKMMEVRDEIVQKLEIRNREIDAYYDENINKLKKVLEKN